MTAGSRKPIISATRWLKWSFPEGRGWTRWRRFTNATIAEAPIDAGTYALGISRSGGLGRLLGADPHAVLDIGRSVTLRSRLSTLKACADTPKMTGHMAGWRLGTLGLLHRLGVTSSDDLRVSWSPQPDVTAAHHHESFLLRAYFELFGELPPLNYQTNWAAYVDDEL